MKYIKQFQLRNEIHLVFFFFISGSILRLLLFWFNPPLNGFDNHLEPILFIINNNALPPKNACWECLQPPVFYLFSAVMGKIILMTGASFTFLLKGLQFMPCFYGILTLPFIYNILKRFPLSNFARLTAFGTACFLPRHIYMSAMLSNDTLSYLLMTICIYLLLKIIDDQFSWVSTTLLVIITTLAIFTKYTALAVLPVIFCAYLYMFAYRTGNRKKVYSGLLFILPVALFCISVFHDYQQYGKPLPSVSDLWDIQITQLPGKGRIDYFDFKPVEAIKNPIFSDNTLVSFWTVIHMGMWFDAEPQFIPYTIPDPRWWKDYFYYINGISPDPPALSLFQMSPLTSVAGSFLTGLGFIPLILSIIGIFYLALNSEYERKGSTRVKSILMIILFVSNTGIVIWSTFKYPHFCTMKASYFLGSISVFAVFSAFGALYSEKFKLARRLLTVIFIFLFALVTFHISHVARALAS